MFQEIKTKCARCKKEYKCFSGFEGELTIMLNHTIIALCKSCGKKLKPAIMYLIKHENN